MATTVQAPYSGAHDFLPYPSPRSQIDSRYETSGAHYDISQYAMSKPTYQQPHHGGQAVRMTQQARPRSPRVVYPRSRGGSIDEGSQSLIYHSLQIPRIISPLGGSLVDLTAQLTTFFWYELPATLTAADNVHSPSTMVRRLTPAALPTEKFKQWTRSILSTTQVTQNVILLALLFVHRLKGTIPRVKGGGGSEYRLLTVALMLANKFLDDNTYTNKTWAEVSNIAVQEVHVMEVEFLSNLRYNLLVSKTEWENWLVKVSRYHEYCERATKPTSPTVLAPSSQKAFISPGPSPPQQHAPYAMTPIESAPIMPYPQMAPAALPHVDPVMASVSAYVDSVNARKRSREDDLGEPAPKRASFYQPQPTTGDLSRSNASVSSFDSTRMPMPKLTLQTPQSDIYAAAPQHAHSQPSQMALPPIAPGVRAMSTVYSASASTWAPSLPSMTASDSSVLPSNGVSTGTMANQPIMHPAPSSVYDTPSKRLSPLSTLTPAAAYSSNSSPLSDRFPHNAVLTPLSQSPSVYLQQRSSPYKPIRHVRTLLYPPPSASLQEYHLGRPSLPPAQMHYQPLGQRNEYRTGIVPEFRGQYMQSGMTAPAQYSSLPHGHHGMAYPAMATAGH